MARAKPNPVEIRAQMPIITQQTPPPLPTFQAPTLATFADRAPTSTPYGDFVAPDPNATSKAMQFRAQQGQQAIERSAAARGTLLNGGTLKALEDFRQGLASTEYDKDFNRALSAYDTNRATNAQNFGQQMDTFQGNLAGFGANTSAQLGAGNLGLNAATALYDRAYDAYRDNLSDQQATASTMPTLDDYAQFVQAQRASQPTLATFAQPSGPRFARPWQPRRIGR